MANRFWVGNGGNINDTAHWSTTSGGAGGASVPTSADNAKFDALSFTLSGQTVTINTSFSCLDMDWTGVTNAPTLTGNFSVGIYGSLTFASTMILTVTGAWSLNATSTGKNITTSGVTLPTNFEFFGIGGGWTLQDNLTSLGNLILTNGSLNTNGKTVACATLAANSGNTSSLTLGASVLNISNTWNVVPTNLTFSCGTSSINMTGNTKSFIGGGLTYNNLTITGTPITITGSNTFNTITILAGKTLKLTSGTTQTVTSFVCYGTLANPNTLQSVTAGSAATIALPAGRYFIRHTSIKDITITGATTVTSIAGTNVSGNTGITFVTKFEIGRIKNDGSFNWYSTATGTVDKVSG